VQGPDFTKAVLGPSIGSCVVSASGNGANPWGSVPATALDAGPAISISGAGGSASIQFQPNALTAIYYGSYLFPSGVIELENSAGAYAGGVDPGGAPTFIPDSAGGGRYTFTNGSGGAAVGPFQASLTLPATFPAWPQAGPLNRANASLSGITVTWSGGDPGSYMQISGRAVANANVANGSAIFAQFTCAVPATAGQFTIPQEVLLSLPASPINYVNPAFVPVLQLVQAQMPQNFNAQGLDFGALQLVLSETVVVSYQ
jgi:hypothetical protein